MLGIVPSSGIIAAKSKIYFLIDRTFYQGETDNKQIHKLNSILEGDKCYREKQNREMRLGVLVGSA